MIVPKNRLLFWVGMVILPFAFVAGWAPSAEIPALVLTTLLTAAALADLFMGFRRLRGIGVELPDLVRISKERDGDLELRIRNERMAAGRLRLGIAFPDAIYSSMVEMFADLPGESTYSVLHWPFKGVKHGRSFLERCYMEVDSPLGFWGVRATAPARTEVRVYPNLLMERRNLASLFLNRGLGIHTQRQVGKGRDFEQLREYMVGDSYEDIHWKATAKRARPVTKVYQIERTQEVYVIVDASRMSARSVERFHNGSRGEEDTDALRFTSILERFVTASLVIDLAAQRQGDLFGVVTFGDRVLNFVRAKSGKAHYDACRDALYTMEPQGVTPDFFELFTFLSLHIRRRALLVFLTSLDDPVLAESFSKSVGLISRRHLVMVNMLEPAGARPLFTSESVRSVDDLYGALGGHFLWGSLHETDKVLQRRGIGFSLLENERMCAQLVSQYLEIKQRQLL